MLVVNGGDLARLTGARQFIKDRPRTLGPHANQLDGFNRLKLREGRSAGVDRERLPQRADLGHHRVGKPVQARRAA